MHTESHPFWSVMIPAHKPNHYVLEAIKSVLIQAPEPQRMQIEVLIDGPVSEDSLEQIRRVCGSRIGIYLHGETVGQARNLNKAIERATGEWIHLLHHDDLVLPGFYAAIEEGIQSAPHIGAAFTRHSFIDEEGHWTRLSHLERRSAGIPEGFLRKLAVYSRFQTPSIAVRKSVYEKLGGFREDLVFALDWEMWVRIACKYDLWFDPRILALYRVNSAGVSSSLVRSAGDINDTKKAIGIMSGYLPSAWANRAKQEALRFHGRGAMEMARRLYMGGDRDGARNQIKEGLAMSKSPAVIGELVRVQLGRLRRALQAQRSGSGT